MSEGTGPRPGDVHPIHLPLPGGGGTIEMRFRYIPAGRFRMGSRGMRLVDLGFGVRPGGMEEPVHWVEITRPYWMAETPVTQAQFGAWTEMVAYRDWHAANRETLINSYDKEPHHNHFDGNPKHPAENLNWHEAEAYCAWLKGAAKNLPAGFEGAGLPTEAQWERACRGPDEPEAGHLGHLCEYYTGDGEAALRRAGWYIGNAGGSTHPVGEKEANGWGLRDVHGNVWEWCRDVWHPNPYVLREDGVQDPETTEQTPGNDPSNRMMRGGSWGGVPQVCRTAFRFWKWPTIRFGFQGFRPVLWCVAAFPGPAEPTA